MTSESYDDQYTYNIAFVHFMEKNMDEHQFIQNFCLSEKSSAHIISHNRESTVLRHIISN